MTTDLLSPILTGIKNTNFFEGRLLTGRDLREQQTANHKHRWQLGKAIGTGIIEGLEVEIENRGQDGTTPVVKVLKGMAINAKGQLLEIPDQYAMVQLSRSFDIPEAEEDFFYNCAGPPDTKIIPNGVGAYILVMAPAAGYQDFAPKSGLQYEGKVRECGRRYIVEGVQFRLVELNPANLSGISEDIASELQSLLTGSNPAKINEPARVSRLRNILAHLCFGTQTLKNLAADIVDRKIGPINRVEAGAISDLIKLELISSCDVPLALLYWTLDGIAYCDLWSVRRQIVTQKKILHARTDFAYPSVRQFHDHLYSYSNLATIESSDYFRFLPPFGQIPVKEPRYGSFSGIELRKFFGSKYRRLPSVIGAGEFKALYRAALNQIPHHINDIDRVEIFYIAENIEALFEGTEQQLIGFFSFAEINANYCPALNVISDGAALSRSSFEALFEASYQAYQDFRKIILLYALSADAQLTNQDVLGLEVINQVLHTASSVLSGLTVGCMSNHRLWASFKRFAHQEQQFADTWIDIVLAQEGGERYLEQIQDLIEEVKSLLESEEIEGFRGLIKALNDHDLFAAYLAQQKINQSFARDIGAGPRGVISINYSIAPVVAEAGDAGEATDTVEPGRYLFGFTLNARVDREATFHLKPRIEAFGWEVELWDEEDQQPRASEFITMPKSNHLPFGESRDVFVRVTATELGESVAELIFDVEEVSGAGGVPKASDTVTLEMGAEIPRPDDRVLVVLDSYGNATPREGGIAIGRDVPSGVQFVIRVTVPGQFAADIMPADGRSWTSLELSTEQFDAPEGTSSEAPYNEVTAALMNPGSEARNTELIFTVSSESEDIDPPIEERFRLSVFIE